MTVAPALAGLALGALGSAHCVAMCGGVASTLAARPALRKGEARPRWRVVLAFQAGRVLTYAALGALAGGALGAAMDAAPVAAARGALRVLAGVMMLGIGLHLSGVWRGFAVIERIGTPVWRRLAPVARRLLPVRGAGEALALGALWGWVPCGMVYTALVLAAASGSAPAGAATMLAFGVGTVPALAGVSMLASRLSRGVVGRRRGWMRRAAGVVVATFGVMSVVLAVVPPRAAAAQAPAGLVCGR